MDRQAIQQRQDLLQTGRTQLAAGDPLLRPMGDLERLAGRAGAGHAGARDLVAIGDGLERLPQLTSRLESAISTGPEWLQQLLNPDSLADLPGPFVKPVEAPPLSSQRAISPRRRRPAFGWTAQPTGRSGSLAQTSEQQERQRSGISTLKLHHHRTFGYFLAVSKASHCRAGSLDPRQTLANEERFITPELKERESRIFQLRARACQREYELFARCAKGGGHGCANPSAARAVAALDALTGLADVAASGSYCAPTINNSRGCSWWQAAIRW